MCFQSDEYFVAASLLYKRYLYLVRSSAFSMRENGEEHGIRDLSKMRKIISDSPFPMFIMGAQDFRYVAANDAHDRVFALASEGKFVVDLLGSIAEQRIFNGAEATADSGEEFTSGPIFIQFSCLSKFQSGRLIQVWLTRGNQTSRKSKFLLGIVHELGDKNAKNERLCG